MGCRREGLDIEQVIDEFGLAPGELLAARVDEEGDDAVRGARVIRERGAR